jgi:hypothetical protein
MIRLVTALLGLTTACLGDQPVLSPRVGVALADVDILRSQHLKPVLMATDAQTLYFSSQSKDEQCVGEGLYQIALTKVKSLTVQSIGLKRHGQALTEPLCVQRLQSSGTSVLVHHRLNRKMQVDRIQDGILSPFLDEGPDPKLRGVWRWKIHQLRIQFPTIDQANWMAIGLASDRVRLAGHLPGDTSLRYVSISLKTSDRTERLELTTLPDVAANTLNQLDFCADERLLGISAPADSKGFGTVFVTDIKSGTTTKYGRNRPYVQDTVWDELAVEDWSARRLGAVSAQPNGVYLADGTTYANEYPLLAFFDFSLQSVFRVKGLHEPWNKQLRAVVPWQQGLLLAYREPPLIAFVGDRNPFKEDVTPTRMPDLQEITETDYLKLLEEVKNAKRD